jgi:hypothetical protein
MVAFHQSRRSGGGAWGVSLKLSRCAGRLFGVIKVQSLLVLTLSLLFFDGRFW